AAEAADAQACPDGNPGWAGLANRVVIDESAILGRGSRYVNFVSQHAIVASCCAIVASAYTRAALGGFVSSRESKISRWAVSSQGVTKEGCQNQAECWMVLSRARFFTCAIWAAKSGESDAGGAARRIWLPEDSTQGRHRSEE